MMEHIDQQDHLHLQVVGDEGYFENVAKVNLTDEIAFACGRRDYAISAYDLVRLIDASNCDRGFMFGGDFSCLTCRDEASKESAA